MKIKSLVQTVALSAVASLMLIGCGGGSDSAPADTTQTGTFVDAPVKGLHYKTATQDGYTGENGEFKFKEGEKIEFKLGNLSLGSVEAGTLVSPYTMDGVATGAVNNKATNIALLLQNLDANRANTAILDVSKLKDFNFSDVNLSVTSATMEALLNNKLTAGDFNAFIDPSNKVLMDTATVKATMDTYVKAQEASKLSVSNIIGKDYVGVECSELLGCEKDDFTAKFTNDTLSGTYEGGNYSGTYETIDGILKITFGGNDIEYKKILNISSNVVSLCEDNSKEVVQACNKPNVYLVTPSNVDTFIATKNGSMKNILTQKTLVTNFSEIQNKLFYMPSVWISGNTYSYNIDALKIEDNNTVYAGYIGASDYQGDESTYQLFYKTYLQNGVASFSNGNLTIIGDRSDFKGNYNSYNETTMVYKYNLADKSFLLSDFATVFDEASWRIFENDSITFTTGNMYCTMFAERCWLDLDAVKTFNNALKVSNKLVRSE